MEKISWTDHVRNEEVLLRVNEQRNILHPTLDLSFDRLLMMMMIYIYIYIYIYKGADRSDKKARKKA